MANYTNITPPRVAFLDERTGLISREWYRFFLNLFQLTGGGQSDLTLVDLQQGPTPTAPLDPATLDAMLRVRMPLGERGDSQRPVNTLPLPVTHAVFALP